MLGIEWRLSMGTCIWLLECLYTAVPPPPHTHSLEGPTYKSRGVLVSRAYFCVHRSSGELLGRSSCRSQVSVPLISRPVPHYHQGSYARPSQPTNSALCQKCTLALPRLRVFSGVHAEAYTLSRYSKTLPGLRTKLFPAASRFSRSL